MLAAEVCRNGVSPRSRIPYATARTRRPASPCPRTDSSVQTALISVHPGGCSRSPPSPPGRRPGGCRDRCPARRCAAGRGRAGALHQVQHLRYVGRAEPYGLRVGLRDHRLVDELDPGDPLEDLPALRRLLPQRVQPDGAARTGERREVGPVLGVRSVGVGGPGGDVDGVAQDPAPALGEVGVRAGERGEGGASSGWGPRPPDGAPLTRRPPPARRWTAVGGPAPGAGRGCSQDHPGDRIGPFTGTPCHAPAPLFVRVRMAHALPRSGPSRGSSLRALRCPGAARPPPGKSRCAQGVFRVGELFTRLQRSARPGAPKGSAPPGRRGSGARCGPACARPGTGEFDSSVGQYGPVRPQLPVSCGTLVETAPPGSPVPVGRFCAPPVDPSAP